MINLQLTDGEYIMSKADKQSTNKQQRNHRANQLNRNIGTNGTNISNAKVHGNRGRQLNPNKK